LGDAVVFLRRLLLVIYVLVAPPLLAAALYYASKYLLAATNRTIDPKVLIYAACVEIVVFLVAVLSEARSRW
jgi:hypothetical protein